MTTTKRQKIEHTNFKPVERGKRIKKIQSIQRKPVKKKKLSQ